MKKKYYVLFSVFVLGLSGCQEAQPEDLVDAGFDQNVYETGVIYSYSGGEEGTTVKLGYRDDIDEDQSEISIRYYTNAVTEELTLSNSGSAYCDVDNTQSMDFSDCVETYPSLQEKYKSAGYDSELSAVTKVYESESGQKIS